MKKLLFISSRRPFPLIGGDKIRYYNSLSILSKKYEIDILYIDDKEDIIEQNDYINSLAKNIFRFYLPKWKSVLNTIMGLFFNSNPLQVNYYYSKKIEKWIKKNYSNYDIIYCNHIRTTEYVKRLSVPKVVDLVDSLGMNYTKAYLNSRGFWKAIYRIEKIRVNKYEKDVVSYFNKCFLISHVDRKFIGGEHNIDIVGNYVSNEFQIKYDDSNCEYAVGFIGKMDYEPNVSAVKYFVQNIFPKIKERYANFKFYIIGAYCPKDILSLSKTDGVIVTGFVADLTPYFEKCSVFVAPMISGAGIQNKILQLMFNGKTVITTPIGAEGLIDLKGDELIISHNKEAFTENILFYLNDSKARSHVGAKASLYVKKYYSYESVSNNLHSFIKDL